MFALVSQLLCTVHSVCATPSCVSHFSANVSASVCSQIDLIAAVYLQSKTSNSSSYTKTSKALSQQPVFPRKVLYVNIHVHTKAVSIFVKQHSNSTSQIIIIQKATTFCLQLIINVSKCSSFCSFSSHFSLMQSLFVSFYSKAEVRENCFSQDSSR